MYIYIDGVGLVVINAPLSSLQSGHELFKRFIIVPLKNMGELEKSHD